MNQLTTDSMKRFKNFLPAVILIFIFFTPLPVLSQAAQQETVSTAETTESTETIEAVPLSLSQAEIEKIEAFVQRQMAREIKPFTKKDLVSLTWEKKNPSPPQRCSNWALPVNPLPAWPFFNWKKKAY